MISWIKQWFKPKGMDEQAAIKRAAVLQIIPQLEQLMRLNIAHCAEEDFNTPKLFTTYIMFVMGAIEQLGESFDEAQQLAALLIYLQKNTQYEEQGISKIIGQTMTFSEQTEWQDIMKQGQQACIAWLNEDNNASLMMRDIFSKQLSDPS